MRMGCVGREHDYPPYRAMGPVTVAEYESRQERYDEQLLKLVEIDPTGLSTKEKMKHLREYREAQYDCSWTRSTNFGSALHLFAYWRPATRACAS